MRKRLFLLLLAFISLCQMYAVERTKLNFNGGWLLKVGDFQGAELANYKDEPTLKSKACLKCLYFTKIISALCCYLEYFSYLYTIN